MKKRRKIPYMEIILGEVIVLMLLISASIYLVNTRGLSINLPFGRINLSEGINTQLTKRAVEAVLSEAAGTSVDIDVIEESMESQDASAVEDIIDKYANGETVKDAVKAYQKNNGDVGKIVNDLKDTVDASDLQKLIDIYQKYSPTVFEEIKRAAQ